MDFGTGTPSSRYLVTSWFTAGNQVAYNNGALTVNTATVRTRDVFVAPYIGEMKISVKNPSKPWSVYFRDARDGEVRLAIWSNGKTLHVYPELREPARLDLPSSVPLSLRIEGRDDHLSLFINNVIAAYNINDSYAGNYNGQYVELSDSGALMSVSGLTVLRN